MKNLGGTRCAHPLCCACPRPRVPFHCSDRLCCVFIHLCEPVCSGSGHTSCLKRSAWARVFAFSHRLAQERVCATFCRLPVVRICWDRGSDNVPGWNNARECACARPFLPGAPTRLRKNAQVLVAHENCVIWQHVFFFSTCALATRGLCLFSLQALIQRSLYLF